MMDGGIILGCNLIFQTLVSCCTTSRRSMIRLAVSSLARQDDTTEDRDELDSARVVCVGVELQPALLDPNGGGNGRAGHTVVKSSRPAPKENALFNAPLGLQQYATWEDPDHIVSRGAD
jgi:hypothetical protein